MIRYLLTTIYILISLSLNAQQYSDYLGNGHHLDVTVTSSSNLQNATGFNTISGIGRRPDSTSASRFLAQATLGADIESIEALRQQGISEWIEEQLNKPIARTYTQDLTELISAALAAHLGRGDSPEDFYTGGLQIPTWWQKIMNSDDLLRDRVTFALSEIIVVSSKSDIADFSEGLISFYDVLYNNAFGNYRDLLYEVTMHPCMASYLTYLNNPKSNLANNEFPDENYAREVMQLFSIGLYELNQNGTRKLDANGNFIPTYNNEDIREFAKIFTGLGGGKYWPYDWINDINAPVYFGAGVWEIDMTYPLQMFEEEHEQGTKTLLNGQIVPAGQTGMEDINDALDNIFNHPNVGPFLGRLLIQRLVKSNPTPEYIERVANAFNDNGQGVRGDMKAVTRAILLDPEARDCSWTEVSTHGMLREPLIRYTHACRAFNASNNNNQSYNWAWSFNNDMGQLAQDAPSVFNFFLPDYQPLGPVSDLDLVAPEFQIFNSATSISSINYVHAWAFWDWIFDDLSQLEPDPDNPSDDIFTRMDYSTEYDMLTYYGDEQTQSVEMDILINHLDILLTHGNLSDRTKSIIKSSLLTHRQQWADNKPLAELAIYLILISPDYAIMK